jgi:hypothetical protein
MPERRRIDQRRGSGDEIRNEPAGARCYAALLVMAPQETPAAYADLRQAIAVIGNYLLLPSLAIALILDLPAMAAYRSFQDQEWAWLSPLPVARDVFAARAEPCKARSGRLAPWRRCRSTHVFR